MSLYQRSSRWLCPTSTPEQLAADRLRKQIMHQQIIGCTSCRHWTTAEDRWCNQYRYTEDAPDVRVSDGFKICNDYTLATPFKP